MVQFKVKDHIRFSEDEGNTWMTAIVTDVDISRRTLTLRLVKEGRLVTDISWDSDVLSLIATDKLIVEADFRSPTHLWFFISGLVTTISWSFYFISPQKPRGAIISGTAGLFGLVGSWFVRSCW